MDYFAGLDVSVKETSVCIVDDTGKIVRETRVASEPGRRTHFDAVTLKGTVAPSGLPAELRPAKAIANIPIAKIDPRTAFALSHPSNSRGFLR
jgi:hypothetical protein